MDAPPGQLAMHRAAESREGRSSTARFQDGEGDLRVRRWHASLQLDGPILSVECDPALPPLAIGCLTAGLIAVPPRVAMGHPARRVWGQRRAAPQAGVWSIGEHDDVVVVADELVSAGDEHAHVSMLVVDDALAPAMAPPALLP